jgi:hypothetical protein
MKKTLVALYALATVFAPALCRADALAADPTALVGTWILERSDNPLPDGSVVPYCTGVHGAIIYTREGYVSVALNCGPSQGHPEPADVSGRKFFYMGKYTFDGANVTHTLLNASQPELIGTAVTRSVRIDGSELILTGENQGQLFSATWRRAE